MCDTSVRYLEDSVLPAVVAALCTRAHGEPDVPHD